MPDFENGNIPQVLTIKVPHAVARIEQPTPALTRPLGGAMPFVGI